MFYKNVLWVYKYFLCLCFGFDHQDNTRGPLARTHPMVSQR